MFTSVWKLSPPLSGLLLLSLLLATWCPQLRATADSVNNSNKTSSTIEFSISTTFPGIESTSSLIIMTSNSDDVIMPSSDILSPTPTSSFFRPSSSFPSSSFLFSSSVMSPSFTVFSSSETPPTLTPSPPPPSLTSSLTFFSPASTEPTTDPTASSAESSSFPPVAIIGVVVAVIAVIALVGVGGLAMLCCVRRSKRSATYDTNRPVYVVRQWDNRTDHTITRGSFGRESRGGSFSRNSLRSSISSIASFLRTSGKRSRNNSMSKTGGDTLVNPTVITVTPL